MQAKAQNQRTMPIPHCSSLPRPTGGKPPGQPVKIIPRFILGKNVTPAQADPGTGFLIWHSGQCTAAAARSGRKNKRQKNSCWAAPLGAS
jgi:hypothetical protein